MVSTTVAHRRIDTKRQWGTPPKGEAALGSLTSRPYWGFAFWSSALRSTLANPAFHMQVS